MSRRCPSGSTPGRKRFTNASLTIATGTLPARSRSVNARPRRMLMPNVSKYAGVTMFTPAPGRRPGPARGRPTISKPWPKPRARHGHAGRQRRGEHAGQRRRAIQELAIEGLDLPRRGQSPARHRQREGEDTLGAEAEVGVHHADERTHRHSAAGEQRQGERELDDHQRAPQPMTPATHRSAALLHRLAQVRARRLPGRRAPGQRCRPGRRSASANSEHRHAQRDLGFRRQRVRRHQRDDGVEEPRRQERTESAAGERDDQALDQQLPDDGAAGGAHRGPHGQLALARAAARQQQVGDVGAGDQQQEPHRAQQQPQPLLGQSRTKLLRNGSTLALRPGSGDGPLALDRRAPGPPCSRWPRRSRRRLSAGPSR